MAFQAASSKDGFLSALFPPANQDFPQASDFMSAGFSTTTRIPSLPTAQNNSPLFPIPVSASPTVVDLITNNTIAYHYVTECANRGDKRKRDVPAKNIGHPMFVKRKDSENITAGPHDAQLQTLEGLNEWLKENSSSYKTDVDVFKDWKFIGIVKNEVMRRSNFMQHRMFNLAIGLRVSAVASPWQTNTKRISAMSKLFFKAVNKDNVWKIKGVIDPFFGDNKDYNGEYLVYAGFAHRSPTVHTNGLEGSWPSEEVFEMFVRA